MRRPQRPPSAFRYSYRRPRTTKKHVNGSKRAEGKSVQREEGKTSLSTSSEAGGGAWKPESLSPRPPSRLVVAPSGRGGPSSGASMCQRIMDLLRFWYIMPATARRAIEVYTAGHPSPLIQHHDSRTHERPLGGRDERQRREWPRSWRCERPLVHHSVDHEGSSVRARFSLMARRRRLTHLVVATRSRSTIPSSKFRCPRLAKVRCWCVHDREEEGRAIRTYHIRRSRLAHAVCAPRFVLACR